MPDEVLLGLPCRSQRRPEKVLIFLGHHLSISSFGNTQNTENTNKYSALYTQCFEQSLSFWQLKKNYFTVKKNTGVFGCVCMSQREWMLENSLRESVLSFQGGQGSQGSNSIVRLDSGCLYLLSQLASPFSNLNSAFLFWEECIVCCDQTLFQTFT